MELFNWEVRVPAFQNSTNVVMCNRVGLEDEMDFAGQTIFCGPDGSCLKMADENNEYAKMNQLEVSLYIGHTVYLIQVIA